MSSSRNIPLSSVFSLTSEEGSEKPNYFGDVGPLFLNEIQLLHAKTLTQFLKQSITKKFIRSADNRSSKFVPKNKKFCNFITVSHEQSLP